MTICVFSSRSESLNPTNSSDEVKGVFLSASGNFAAALTESVLTLFDLKSPEIPVVGALDVNDILEAGGSRFRETEGTLVQVCWDPQDRFMYASTKDSLIGVIRLVESSALEAHYSLEDDPIAIDTALVLMGKSRYTMKLETVLLLPVAETVLVEGRDCLIVAASRKRALFLLDWNNFQTRARRFVYPALASEEEPGSPCVNSVLPSFVESEVTELPDETDKVLVGALSGGSDQTLFLGYESGIVRSFAFSKPSEPMCGILPSQQVLCFSVENDLIGLVQKSDPCKVLIYRIESPVLFTLMREFSAHSSVTRLAWSHECLAVGQESGLVIYNRHQSSYLFQAPVDSCVSFVFSVPSRLLISLRKHSSVIDITKLGVSADASSRCHSSESSLLINGRDALRLLSPPGRQWRYIACPPVYMQDNGMVVQAAVQQNQSSKFIIISGMKGFALWSSYSSTSALKREGRWEVLPDKSQEERIGQIDIFGFLSETVFFSKSIDSSEAILWSVLKRLDISFALSSMKLHEKVVDRSAVNSQRGILALLFSRLQRIDIYQLRTDIVKESYSLELVSSVPADFPLPLRSLVLVPNGRACSVVGLSYSNEIFLRTGERVCGNIDSMHACEGFGVDREVKKSSFNLPPSVESGVSTPSITGIHTPQRSEVESSESSEAETDSEDMSPSEATETFFIGETSCRFCDRLKRVPKTKKRICNLINRERPFLFLIDSTGGVSVWILSDGREYAARIEFATRFSSELSLADGVQVVSVCKDWGIMSTVNGTDLRIAHISCVHPILAIASPADAYRLCSRLNFSPFFTSIIEMWLHQELTTALPILSALKGPFDSLSLTQQNPDLCNHPLTRTVLTRLLHAMFVSSHFPNVFPSVFAAAVRKSEPHITFPLATAGAFTGSEASELFNYSVRQGRLREAALLLVVIQEKAGPVAVRESFAIPIFREALIVQEYALAREIAHFHFSFSKKRTLAWSPCSGTSIDDLSDEILLMTIDTVVVSHFNYLVNESLDWFRLVRFVERLRLVLGDWLLVVPRHEYLDVAQLVQSFRVALETVQMVDAKSDILDVLLQGFRKAKWMAHWKSLLIAADSVEGLREWFSESSEECPAEDSEIRKLIAQYI